MKTKKILMLASFFMAVCAALFFSCENPISLGSKIDLEGVIVEFTYPAARKAVPSEFLVKGTAFDSSGIDKMLLTVENNNTPFPKQWRYSSSGSWEVSSDYGMNWKPFSGAEWKGDSKDASWTIPVDMKVNGVPPQDGEYLFILQAWDTGGFTDANSYKTRVLIIDNDLPMVNVSEPYLYRYDDADLTDPDSALSKLDDILDTDNEKTDPAFIGKFITQSFKLQWQIEDNYDVWSIDLRFYKLGEYIDEAEWTDLPGSYIYQYKKNDLIPPEVSNPKNNIKPNGTITVPALEGAISSGSYDGGTWELKNPIDAKETIQVVAACYDAAGHINQEKVLGYFVYWPAADYPWISYNDGMEPPASPPIIIKDVFMIYPGRDINANAFHAHGLKEVIFSLYNVSNIVYNATETSITSYTIESSPREDFINVHVPNPPRANGSYSTIFKWKFTPPPRTGYFVVKAKAYSEHKESVEYEALFRVQDITYPNFPEEPKPMMSTPLFASITSDNKFTITGTVSDATEIKYLTMVWINPESRNYAAMSQLQYLRDQDYQGWNDAKGLTPGATILEVQPPPNSPPTNPPYPYDENYPNRLWSIPVQNKRLDPFTNRQLYDFTITVNLIDLNIGTGTYNSPTGVVRPQQPLISQVFMLMAENPQGKTEIFTYAPQGDTLSPKLGITNVVVTRADRTDTYTPNSSQVVEQFANNDRITINGTWEEDSAAYLDPQTYFKPKMEIEVNAEKIALTDVTVNQTTPSNPAGTGSTSGTWSAYIIVGAGQLSADSLKDTLVVNSKVEDFGGNKAEVGSSWLIQTDYLRLMRVSSEMADGVYRQFYSGTDQSTNPSGSNYYPDKIRFFLEFNKPVNLSPGSSNPVLYLNSGATNTTRTATYVPNSAQSTRQYFEYVIQAGDDTTLKPESYLNVTGINTAAIEWTANNYPLIWQRGSGETLEEIRVTNINTHDGTDSQFQSGGFNHNNGYRVRQLPMTTDPNNTRDYPFTLAAGRNITIDTTPPEAGAVTANTAQGYYTTGAEIYITVKFTKPVKIGATLPRLALQVTNTTLNYTTAYTDDDNSGKVRVNGDEITFVYTVKAGDIGTSNVPPTPFLTVTGQSGGDITDLAGNLLPTSGTGSIAGLFSTAKNLNGIYIDAIRPATPILRVLPSNTTANDANVVKSIVGAPGGTANEGRSNQSNRALVNLYNDELWLAVQSQDQSVSELDKLEYSINNGTSWVSINSTNTPIQLTQLGSYTIIARQTDKAGNVSVSSQPVSFTWDKGRLISRISSTSANGTYTHNPGRSQINITVTFRKTLTFTTADPLIHLNAQNGGANKTVNGGGSGTSLSFTYSVIDGDGIPDAALLDVLNISGFTDVRDSDDVQVSDLLNNVIPLEGQEALLKENKSIKVETGNLIRSTTVNPSIYFQQDTSNGTTQGIQADGSYWTTLHIVFNHDIFKGSGTITIEQKDAVGAGTGGGYRIPAVLTESQYNRFRGVAAVGAPNDNFNKYYTKGTNGYIYTDANNHRSDTSTKYVLNYNYNPNSAAASDDTFVGDTPITSGFFNAFKAAEAISINVTAQAVETSGNILKVRLTGSNAPQVPGATYVVKYSPDLVSDSLGNNSPAQTSAAGEDVPLDGVARPFVRIKKTQDLILARAAASNTTPTLTATQPLWAYVRMDCRTPNSTIHYRDQGTEDSVTAVNWSNTGNPPTASSATYPITNEVQYSPPFSGNNASGIRIGSATHGGYKWWVRAYARANNNNSAESHEMAYRTAITYRLMGVATNATTSTDMVNPVGSAQGTTAQRRIFDGDQIWIRGGDAIGSSSIPGFPFTWEDDFASLDANQKRAGIRLMTKVNNTTHTGGGNQNQLWNSQWQFLTWDINATAYVDFILGRDQNYNEVDNTNGVNTQFYASASEAEVWQYGPRSWALQRAGWSALKTQYPIFPGEHRWVNTGTNLPSTDNPVNYANAFNTRGSQTVSISPANTN